MGNLMKQAQKMQEGMQKLQEDLAKSEVTGEAGAGLVQVIMSGQHDVRKITIDPSLFNEDREMLEDLLAAAVNDAVRKVEDSNKKKMASLASGFGLPPSVKMPF